MKKIVAGLLISLFAMPLFAKSSKHTVSNNSTPSHSSAILDLFGKKSKTGKVKTAKNKLSSVWFEQTFKNGGDNLHVIFFKTQELMEDSNEIAICNGCGVEVSAVTYKQISGKWKFISKKLYFTTIGYQGGTLEIKQAEIMKLSPGIIALKIPIAGVGQGCVNEADHLISYSESTWHSIGVIDTGFSCSGGSPDYGYEGKISMLPGKNPKYPDLLVTVKGNNWNFESSKLVPVKNYIYTYNGKEYFSKDNPQGN